MPSFGVYHPDDWKYLDALKSGAESRNLKVATFSRLLIEQALDGSSIGDTKPDPLSDSVVIDLARVILSPRMAAELAILLGDVDQVAELRALLHARLEDLRAANGEELPHAAEPRPVKTRVVRRHVDPPEDERKQA